MKSIDKSIEEIANENGYTSEILDVLKVTEIPEEEEERVEEAIAEYEHLYEILYKAETREERIATAKELKRVLKSIEQYIDKRQYLYCAYRSFSMRKELAKQGKEKPLNQAEEEALSALIKYIRGGDLLIRADIVFDEDTGKATIKTSEDFLGEPPKRKNRELVSRRKFDMVQEKIDVDMILGRLHPADILFFCRYQDLANEMARKVMKPIDRDNEEIKEQNFSEEELKNGVQYMIPELVELVKVNAEYMDIDKMMLMALRRCHDDIESRFTELDQDSLDEFIDILEKLQKIIPEEKRTLHTVGLKGMKSLDEMLEEARALSKRFINGKITFEQDVEEVRRCILAGEMGYSEISPKDYVRTMEFSKAELLEIASHDVKAIEFYRKNGLLTEEELEELESPRKLIELYMKKDLSPENEREFEIFRKVFKGLTIDGKTDEEKDEVGLLIVDQSLELLEEERLKELYELGLITCDNYVGLVGNLGLKELVEQGAIKPVDVRKLFDKGSISLEDFESILESSTIENEEKLLLVYSTFPKKEDREVRDELVQFLTDIVENKGRRKKPKDGEEVPDIEPEPEPNPEPEPEPKPHTKGIYDPCAKWAFLSALDPDYSKRYFPKDGHVIMFLPNRGTYIIEKLYDQTKKKGMPRYAYGSATYVMTEEEFARNREILIEEGRIDRTELAQMRRDGKVKKFVHKGWAQSICRYFGLDVPDRYTEEQKKEIKKLAEEVENSKIME